jgi:hypothetical protein
VSNIFILKEDFSMQKIKMSRGTLLTFEEGCNKYLENCRQRNLRDGTINHYRQSYVQFYKFFDIIMTRFNDDNIEAEFVTLDICGFESENGTELRYTCLMLLMILS